MTSNPDIKFLPVKSKIAKDITSQTIMDPDWIYLDKCYICGIPAPKACGSCELEFYCSKEHQKQDWPRHRLNCSKYEIKDCKSKGFKMVATAHIEPGMMLAAEHPLATFNLLESGAVNLQKALALSGTVPASCPSCDTANLYSGKLSFCSKCSIPVCKDGCQKPEFHDEAICKVLGRIKHEPTSPLMDTLMDLAIFRLLYKAKKKGDPICFENRKWKWILRNVFSEKIQKIQSQGQQISEEIVNSLRRAENFAYSLKFCGNRELVILLYTVLKCYGLPVDSATSLKRKKYLYSKLMCLSHSCIPNAEMWIDAQDHYKLKVKAIIPIKPGILITVNKLENVIPYSTPTVQRRLKLKEYFNIDCNCERCCFPNELESFICGIRCEENLSTRGCFGHYLPKNFSEPGAPWICIDPSCKSFKTIKEIQKIVKNAEQELPTVTGRMDVVLKKLKAFVEYYSGDVLHSSHHIILTAWARTRKVVRYFLGSGEQMVLCVVNDYPRAYEHCTTFLLAVDAMLHFTDYMNAKLSLTAAKLLYEKACCDVAVAFYEYGTLRVHTGRFLLRKVQLALKVFQKSNAILSTHSSPDASDIKCNITFFIALVKKLFAGFQITCTSDLSKISSFSIEKLEKTLPRRFSVWKNKCKEIGLIKFYLEPASSETAPSVEILRQILKSDG